MRLDGNLVASTQRYAVLRCNCVVCACRRLLGGGGAQEGPAADGAAAEGEPSTAEAVEGTVIEEVDDSTPSGLVSRKKEGKKKALVS